MAAKKSGKAFDLEAFMSGVKRPQSDVTLCVDTGVRARLDSLIDELEKMPSDADESLAGNPRRDAILDEIRVINDDESLWTRFTVQAPSRSGRVTSVLALAEAEDDGRAPAVLDAEAKLLADCLVAVDGNPVDLTVEQATHMQYSWPDGLIQELVNAIREFGSDVNSVPFSQRLSQILETGTSSQS